MFISVNQREFNTCLHVFVTDFPDFTNTTDGGFTQRLAEVLCEILWVVGMSVEF